jgi:hypothetical protein
MSKVNKVISISRKNTTPAKGMAQREAVFKAILATFKKHGIKFEEGHQAKRHLSQEMRQEIYATLEKGFVDGKIEFKVTESNLLKLADQKALRSYVIGLVMNWLRKDERLCGRKAA